MCKWQILYGIWLLGLPRMYPIIYLIKVLKIGLLVDVSCAGIVLSKSIEIKSVFKVSKPDTTMPTKFFNASQ